MSRKRKILLSLLIALPLLLLAAAFLLMAMLQPQLKTLFEQELNKRLLATVHLQGDATVSLFRHFPDASFTFHDVLVSGGKGFEEDTLLSAARLSFQFNPFSLMSGNYRIQAIHLQDARIMARIDKRGQPNYLIIEQDTTSSDAGAQVNLSLQRARFTNTNIHFENKQSDWLVSTHLEETSLRGDFAASLFSLDVTGNISLDTLCVDGDTWLSGLPLVVNLSAEVNTNLASCILHQLELGIEGDTYKCEGVVTEVASGWQTDIEVTGQRVRLASLIALLPPTISQRLWGLSSKGDLTFSAQCRGVASEAQSPVLSAQFGLENGLLTHPDLPRAISNVYLEGLFTTGEEGAPGSFTLPTLSLMLGENPIKGHFSLADFSNPTIDIGLDAVLDMAQLSDLLATVGWQDAAGRLAVEGLILKGPLHEFSGSSGWHRLSAGGKLVAAGLQGSYQEQPWQWTAGALELNKNQLDIQDIVINVGQSDLAVTGKVENLLSWITTLSVGDVPGTLSVDIGIGSGYLNYQDLAPFFGATDVDSSKQSDNYLSLFTGIRGKIDVNVDSLDIYTFHGSDVSGRLRPSAYLSRLEALSVKVAGGRLLADGLWRIHNDQLQVEGTIKGEQLAADGLFQSFYNFWQDFLVADNLSGDIEGEIDLYLAWDKSLHWLEEATDIKATLTVHEGRLVNFEPMQQLSDFVKVEELQDIRFSSMRNMIYVRGNKVFIPAMEIRSTALNLWLAGTHTFDNTIDYQFKINLMDMLARKFRLGRMDLERAEQREEGVFNVYVTMTGTVDEPVFNTDRARVLEGFAASVEWLEPGFINFDEEDMPRARTKPRSSQGDEELEFIDW